MSCQKVGSKKAANVGGDYAVEQIKAAGAVLT
jgi:hypothetical protein